VEDVAVGEHGDYWGEIPRLLCGDGGEEGEDTPEEDEDAERDGQLFGDGEAYDFREVEKCEVEEYVLLLPDYVDAWGFALVHELGEPGVVDVAAEVAGLEEAVPVDGDQDENGDGKVVEEWGFRVRRRIRHVGKV